MSERANRCVVFDRDRLDFLYRRFHHRRYVHPDPLEFLYFFHEPADREVVGLIAATLAYGRVEQILKSVAAVLDGMGPNPADFLLTGDRRLFQRKFGGFVHRFARGDHLVGLLTGLQRTLQRHGCLYNCFCRHLPEKEETVLAGLAGFARELIDACDADPGHLISDPKKGSACKRLNLFLRWMVRKDAVDPGDWNGIRPSRLIMPIDVHIFRICSIARWTRTRQADMRAALDITERFRAINPEDPVRYDFVLSRFGIRKDMQIETLFRFDSPVVPDG